MPSLMRNFSLSKDLNIQLLVYPAFGKFDLMAELVKCVLQNLVDNFSSKQKNS